MVFRVPKIPGMAALGDSLSLKTILARRMRPRLAFELPDVPITESPRAPSYVGTPRGPLSDGLRPQAGHRFRRDEETRFNRTNWLKGMLGEEFPRIRKAHDFVLEHCYSSLNEEAPRRVHIGARGHI